VPVGEIDSRAHGNGFICRVPPEKRFPRRHLFYARKLIDFWSAAELVQQAVVPVEMNKKVQQAVTPIGQQHFEKKEKKTATRCGTSWPSRHKATWPMSY
jgi:hypothetical protein